MTLPSLTHRVNSITLVNSLSSFSSITPKLLYTNTLHNNKVIPNIYESIFLSLNTECKPSVSNIKIA